MDALVIVLIVIVIIVLIMIRYMADRVVNLSKMETQDKEEMIQLMKIKFIRRKITIERMEYPRISNNILYRIYFTVKTTENIIENNLDKVQSNFHLEFENLGVNNDDEIEYCCIIAAYNGNEIEFLEGIKYKYRDK